jgi:hypothetical protein
MGTRRGPEIRDMLYVTEMPDGSRWGVPVEFIALNRAKNYADEFGGNTALSLEEDTWPLFEADDYEVEDWAANNMNWEDVSEHAIRLPSDEDEVDCQEGWTNGEHSFEVP